MYVTLVVIMYDALAGAMQVAHKGCPRSFGTALSSMHPCWSSLLVLICAVMLTGHAEQVQLLWMRGWESQIYVPAKTPSAGQDLGSDKPACNKHGCCQQHRETGSVQENSPACVPEVVIIAHVVRQGHVPSALLLARGEVGSGMHAQREHLMLLLPENGCSPITLSERSVPGEQHAVS